MRVKNVSLPQKESLNYPLKVKHIFLTFMQEFCSMQNPDALLYYDQDNMDNSNVLILDSFAHDIEHLIDQKPLIVFKRGPIYVAQGTLYDNLLRMESRPDPRWTEKGENFHRDVQYRTFMVSGQCDWHCISRQGMEAEEMAAIVAFVHQAHVQVLRQKGIHAVKSVQVGDENLIAGDVETEAVMVPVSIAYDMQVHYEYWLDGDPHRHSWLKGKVGDDLLLDTDP